MGRFGTVGPPYFSDKPVFLLGGGPSLHGFKFSRLGGLGYVIGVNQGMLDSPICDAGVSMDIKFIEGNRDDLDTFGRFTPLYLSLGNHWFKNFKPIDSAIYLHSEEMVGLSTSPAIVRAGPTSGSVAFNVALLKRARRIILLGYDYGTAAGGRHHYHTKYPWFHEAEAMSFPQWAKRYDGIALDCVRLGVQVANASPSSNIEVFPKMSIDEALKWADQSASMGCTVSATTSISAPLSST